MQEPPPATDVQEDMKTFHTLPVQGLSLQHEGQSSTAFMQHM